MTITEHRADYAWKLMTRPRTILTDLAGVQPMEPPIALDYVQDECGERDDAVTALLEAASRALGAEMPAEDVANIRAEADGLLSDLRGEFFGHARATARTIAFRAADVGVSALAGLYRHTPNPPNVGLCEDWRQWGNDAEGVVTWCEKVVEAAYPS